MAAQNLVCILSQHMRVIGERLYLFDPQITNNAPSMQWIESVTFEEYGIAHRRTALRARILKTSCLG